MQFCVYGVGENSEKYNIDWRSNNHGVYSAIPLFRREINRCGGCVATLWPGYPQLRRTLLWFRRGAIEPPGLVAGRELSGNSQRQVRVFGQLLTVGA